MSNKALEAKLEEAAQLLDNTLADFSAKKYTEAGESLDKAYNLLDEVESQIEDENDLEELRAVASNLDSESTGTPNDWRIWETEEPENLAEVRKAIELARDQLKEFEFSEPSEE